MSEHAADVLQATEHQCYELRRSIVITSNRVMPDRGKCLADVNMATTILDRFTHRCAMLEFEDKGYRLKKAAARIAVTPESPYTGDPAWESLTWPSRVIAWPGGARVQSGA